MATFGPRYPRGKEYLAQLDRIERRLKQARNSNITDIELDFIHLQRQALIDNPLVSGRPIRIDRHTGTPVLRGNLVKHVPDWFVDPARGDLHLKPTASEAIDKAAPIENEQVFYDVDRRPRGEKPDIGADEFLQAGPPTHSLLDQPWYPKAPPLPKPTGEVIRAKTVDELFAGLERDGMVGALFPVLVERV